MNDDFEMPDGYDPDKAAEEPIFEIPQGFKEFWLELDEIARREDDGSPEVFKFSDFNLHLRPDIEP